LFDERFDKERPKINIWMALTREEARGLLDELATEGSAFRKALEDNPREALKRLPIDIRALDIPDKIELPSAPQFARLTNKLDRNFDKPSIPAGYALYMLVLPFGCPSLGDDDGNGDDKGGSGGKGKGGKGKGGRGG
jgi:hypothetical protein